MSVETVPCFESVSELRYALDQKALYTATIDLYPRNGTRLLGETEARMAELARAEEGTLLLCASGMAAVVAAVESVAKPSAVIACAEQSYSQTAAYIENLTPQSGRKVVRFDASCDTSIERVLQKYRPDVVLAETVGNGPDMPVLNVKALLDLSDVYGLDPAIVLDNTLPLSTAMDIGRLVCAERKVVVVESGTKSYTFNNELCGIIHTKHQGLLENLQKRRRMLGFGPNVAGVEKIAELLPDSLEEFDVRNNQIFSATADIATACQSVEKPRGAYVTCHPTLQAARALLRHAVSPVLYLQCTGGIDQFELTEQLWSNPVIQEQAQLGQSFGFDHVRILPDANFPAVRIAGGASTTPELVSAVRETLSTL